MIKFFKSQDIIITPFTIAKRQTLNSIVSDLILGTDGNDTFPLIGNTLNCDDNISGSCELINSEVYIATSQFDDEINFRLGKFIFLSSVFYPSGSTYFNSTTNPLNLDGTYQRQVYNTTKKMYYNDYNNAYNIFGFDGFDTSKAHLQLPNDFSEINLRSSQAGDKIRPRSLLLNNQSGDIVADVKDDGNHNLILSGTYFINKYKLSSDSYDLTVPLDICGLGAYLSNTSSYVDTNCCSGDGVTGGDGIGGSPGGGGGPTGPDGPGGNDLPPPPPPTPSITPTPTPTLSVTPSVSITVTPSISVTPTISMTPTVSRTVTPSITATPSMTPTNTLSITPSISVTPSVSLTITPSISITPTISLTITPSITVTPSSTDATCNTCSEQIDTFYLSLASYDDWRTSNAGCSADFHDPQCSVLWDRSFIKGGPSSCTWEIGGGVPMLMAVDSCPTTNEPPITQSYYCVFGYIIQSDLCDYTLYMQNADDQPGPSYLQYVKSTGTTPAGVYTLNIGTGGPSTLEIVTS